MRTFDVMSALVSFVVLVVAGSLLAGLIVQALLAFAGWVAA